MGIKNYVGFPDNKLKQIKSIIIQVNDAIGKAYAMHMKDTDGEIFAKWFGVGDRLVVRNILHKMNYAMLNGVVTINYNTNNCTPNTNAVAYAPAYGWNVATVAQARSPISNFVIDICPCLLEQMSLLSSDKQSQIGTVVHEISHLLGGTDDIVDPLTGHVAYGANLSKSLARHNPHLAIMNAENYGFYISEFK